MEKHSISTVIEHYGGKELRDAYGWQKIKCPFHEDSHASATANAEMQAFNCFGCGIKGDVYKIIMEKEGVDFREAYAFAERITGESGIALSGFNRSGRGVSGRSRTNSGRRGYSPPGLGRRTANRA